MNNLEQNNQLIADVFKKEKAFVTFITAGDPSLDKTAEFILEMDKRCGYRKACSNHCQRQ